MVYQGHWWAVTTEAKSFKFLDPGFHSLESVHRNCCFHHPEIPGGFKVGISQLEWDKNETWSVINERNLEVHSITVFPYSGSQWDKDAQWLELYCQAQNSGWCSQWRLLENSEATGTGVLSASDGVMLISDSNMQYV